MIIYAGNMSINSLCLLEYNELCTLDTILSTSYLQHNFDKTIRIRYGDY